MAVRIPKPQLLTVEEWEALEQQTGIRHEYLDGLVFAVAGESKDHNRIVKNIVIALDGKATAKGCELFFHNVRLKLQNHNRYYYPDVIVSCQPEPDPYHLTQPCFIVEVLSPSTAERDEREKLEAYLKLPTLKTYVLVAQIKTSQRVSETANYLGSYRVHQCRCPGDSMPW